MRIGNCTLYLISRSREEKGIPLCVSSHALGIVSARIKLLPHARWENMLVPLVPSPIDDLGEVGVVLGAF